MSSAVKVKLTLMILVVGLVMVAIAYTAVRLVLSKTDDADSVGPRQIVEEFDPLNAEFYSTRDDGTPGKRVKLNDGRYESMRIVAEQRPAYADVDSDGDLDAAAVLEHSGAETDDRDGAWRAMYLWLWEDGEVVPVKWRAGWEWTCSSSLDDRKLTISDPPSGYELPTMHALQFAECPDNTVEDPDGDGDIDLSRAPHFVGVEKGVPVRHLNAFIASNALCTLEDGEDVEVSGDVEPLVIPDKGAPKVSDGYTGVQVADPDRMAELFGRDDNNGYVPAKVTWPIDDGEVEGCGWIKWTNVP